MSDTTKKLIVYLIAVFGFFVWALSPDKEAKAEKAFFISKDIYLTGIVDQVMPSRNESRGYGVIYLKNFKSNKGTEYECTYKDRYLFCRIHNKEAILVTPSSGEIEPGDSIVYNTKLLQFRVYNKGRLFVYNGIAINDDKGFYHALMVNGYLDFSYFHKKGPMGIANP